MAKNKKKGKKKPQNYEVAIKKDENAHTGYFMPVYHFNIIASERKTPCPIPSFTKVAALPKCTTTSWIS